jgi:hypothetical protein
VDATHWDGLRGRLFGVLTRLDDRFLPRDATLIHEFIEVGEFGLALEQMADVLAEDGTPITDEERADMLALNEDMKMGERVPRVLATCPTAL